MAKKIVTLERLEAMAVQNGFELGEILNDFNVKHPQITKKQCLSKGVIQSALGDKVVISNIIDNNSINRLVTEDIISFNTYETHPLLIRLNKLYGNEPFPANSFKLNVYCNDGFWTGKLIDSLEFPDSACNEWSGEHEIKLANSILDVSDNPIYFSLKYNGGYYTQLLTMAEGDGHITYTYGNDNSEGFESFDDLDEDGYITSNDGAITVGKNSITWPLRSININMATTSKTVTPPTAVTYHNMNMYIKTNNSYNSDLVDNAEIEVAVKYKDGTNVSGGSFYMPSAYGNSVAEDMKVLNVNGSKLKDCTIGISSNESYSMECKCGNIVKTDEGAVTLEGIYLEDGLSLEVIIK